MCILKKKKLTTIDVFANTRLGCIVDSRFSVFETIAAIIAGSDSLTLTLSALIIYIICLERFSLRRNIKLMLVPTL